jgi:hypothetical protein
LTPVKAHAGRVRQLSPQADRSRHGRGVQGSGKPAPGKDSDDHKAERIISTTVADVPVGALEQIGVRQIFGLIDDSPH